MVLRLGVLVLIAVLPLLVVPGSVGVFELPKQVLAVTAAAGLMVLSLPRLRDGWRRSSAAIRATYGICAAFALWMTVATLISDEVMLAVFGPDMRYFGWLALMGALAMVVVVPAALQDHEAIDQAILVIAVMLAVLAVFLQTQALGLDLAPWTSRSSGRPVGTFGNTNFVGAIGALGAPLVVYLWNAPRQRRRWAPLLAVLTVSTILLAASSLGVLAAIVGVTAALIVLAPRRLPRTQGWLIAAIPALAPLFGMLVVVVGNAVGLESAVARYKLWAPALAMWRDHLVVGVGWTRFRANYRGYRTPETVQRGDLDADSSHAWLVDLAAMSGTVGVVLGLAVLVATGMVLRQAWSTGQTGVVPLTSVLVGLLAASGAASALTVPTLIQFWFACLMVGLAVATAMLAGGEPAADTDVGAGRASRMAVGIGALVAVAVVAAPLSGFYRSAVDLMYSAAHRQDADLDAARDRSRRAVARTPWWPRAWMELARVEEADGDLAASRAAAVSALGADPSHLVAVQHLASIEAAAEAHDAAAAWFEMSYVLDPYGYRNRLDVAEWALATGQSEVAGEALARAFSVMDPSRAPPIRYDRLRRQHQGWS